LDRYNRHIILPEIGELGQKKINDARVLVVGAGGLACPVLQYLTAAGVGCIGIVDFDIVDISNLQRQILFGNSSLGKNKAIAAKESLSNLNPLVDINVYDEKLTGENALDIFSNYDMVVDGTDNFSTRYLINDAAVISNIPLIYGAIYKFEGQLSVFNYENGPTYRCLFPDPPKSGSIANCSEIGVLGVLPGIIGCMQANEVLKIILGIGEVLSGKLLCYNTLDCSSTILKLKKNTVEVDKIMSKKENFTEHIVEVSCGIESVDLSIQEAMLRDNVQFVDVREVFEQPKIDVLNPTCIPLSDLEDNLNLLDKQKAIIFFCKSGVRSKNAVYIVEKYGYDNSFSIKNNIFEIEEYLNTKLP